MDLNSTSQSQPNPILKEIVVLDVIFSYLGLDDLKNCRLVCNLWAQTIVNSILKLPSLLKPIQLGSTQDFQNLIHFLSSQKQVFSQESLKLFQLTSFSFDIQLLANLHVTELENFAQNFSPKYLEVIGDDYPHFKGQRTPTQDHQDFSPFQQKLPILLKNSSNTLVELKLDFVVNKNVVNFDEILTGFPHLTKFYFTCKTYYDFENECQIVKKIFCPIVQNSPKLSTLVINTGLGAPSKFREYFINSKLPQKLVDLTIFDLSYEHLEVLTEFGRNAQLQLNKFTYSNCKGQNWSKSLVDFLTSQSESLTHLHILWVIGKRPNYNIKIKNNHPVIRNLQDYEKIFGVRIGSNFNRRAEYARYNRDLDFYLQQNCPRLDERPLLPPYDVPKTSQVRKMLIDRIFKDGHLIQKVILKKDIEERSDPFDSDHFSELFNRLKLLEIDSDLIEDSSVRKNEKLNFWHHLEKVTIHLDLKDLFKNIRVFSVIKRVELEVKCPDQMDESYLGQMVAGYTGLHSAAELEKVDYRGFLRRFSHYVKPKLFRMVGQKVPLNIQKDVKDIFANFVYIERSDPATLKKCTLK